MVVKGIFIPISSGYNQGRNGPQLTLRFLTRCGAGRLEATNAPFPGDVTQSELLHHLPGNVCAHPGILHVPSFLLLQLTALAAGKCLLGVSGFPCSEVLQEALITPDLVQLGACRRQPTAGSW